jgi:hypothetical protein
MPERTVLPAIQRPDGRLYHPRKITACAVTEDDFVIGVVVFGTHDEARAQPLADQYAAWQNGSGAVARRPELVWWRDGYESGHRRWVTDEGKGRAGVWFREITERPAQDRAVVIDDADVVVATDMTTGGGLDTWDF